MPKANRLYRTAHPISRCRNKTSWFDTGRLVWNRKCRALIGHHIEKLQTGTRLVGKTLDGEDIRQPIYGDVIVADRSCGVCGARVK